MKNPGEFVLTLLNARTAAHVAHLSVSGPGSFARHTALAEFYEGIAELADRYAHWFVAAQRLLADLSSDARAAIFGGNAARVYLSSRGRPASRK